MGLANPSCAETHSNTYMQTQTLNAETSRIAAEMALTACTLYVHIYHQRVIDAIPNRNKIFDMS